MRDTFKKEEKLKSKKLIEQLFIEGKKLKSFPLLLVYLQVPHTSDYKIQAGFSVPKRRFKRAVDRNRIKRLVRESYRLQKNRLQELYTDKEKEKYIFMFVFIGNKIPDYTIVYKAMQELLKPFK